MPFFAAYWARVELYVPFTMGGNVWRSKRFEVQGIRAKLDKYHVFLSENPSTKKWELREAATGGFICAKETMKAALKTGKKLIRSTPDFDAQLKEAGDIMRFPIMPTDEAYKMLAKGKKEPAYSG